MSSSGAFYARNNGAVPIVLNDGFTYEGKTTNHIDFSPDVYSSIYKVGVNTVQPSALRSLALIRAY